MGYVSGKNNTNQIQNFDVSRNFGVKEELAVQLFERVVNKIDNGKVTSGLADGTVSKNGTAWSWLNAYNAPHWMDIGGQMEYQAGVVTQRTDFSLSGWNNTQTGSGKSVEYYGTSWTRDLMVAKRYASDNFISFVIREFRDDRSFKNFIYYFDL